MKAEVSTKILFGHVGGHPYDRLPIADAKRKDKKRLHHVSGSARTGSRLPVYQCLQQRLGDMLSGKKLTLGT